MNRGYVLLWRSFWENRFLKEKGKSFSKREAWLYLFSNLANGIDRDGIPRGQFEASYRYLAKVWNWETTKVFRFIKELEREKMIFRNQISMQHQTQHLPQHFTICKYELYQNPRNTDRNTKRNKSKEGIKESINKSLDAPRQNSRNQDSAYDLFVSLFSEKNGSPYVPCTGDFPQLMALRKSFSIGSRDTPPGWESACRNYMNSPMSSFSIAFMVTANRYAILRNSRLDRFGKPINENPTAASRLATDEDKRNYNPNAKG
jgi:hypothetical protein